MIKSSPRADTAIINNLGDLLHYDGMKAVTPTSGHVLDADSRFAKVAATAFRIMRRVIDTALERHRNVIVLACEGNHDEASSVWLRVGLAALYEREPRVTVDQSPKPYYAHQHGRTMLAFHHGHLAKMDGLPAIFADEFAPMWGTTSHRYAHTGHRHHEHIKELRGMKVVQHSTLAARDAYAARGGWGSMRQATAYTYSTEYGQVGSVTVTPEMVA